MNASELALAMLEWESKKHELDELGAKICNAVLEIGKTQTVGSVRATYSRGRRSYRYDQAINKQLELGNISEEDLIPFLMVSYDYKTACDDLHIDDVPFAQGDPSVSLKLLGE